MTLTKTGHLHPLSGLWHIDGADAVTRFTDPGRTAGRKKSRYRSGSDHTGKYGGNVAGVSLQ